MGSGLPSMTRYIVNGRSACARLMMAAMKACTVTLFMRRLMVVEEGTRRMSRWHHSGQ